MLFCVAFFMRFFPRRDAEQAFRELDATGAAAFEEGKIMMQTKYEFGAPLALAEDNEASEAEDNEASEAELAEDNAASEAKPKGGIPVWFPVEPAPAPAYTTS